MRPGSWMAVALLLAAAACDDTNASPGASDAAMTDDGGAIDTAHLDSGPARDAAPPADAFVPPDATSHTDALVATDGAPPLDAALAADAARLADARLDDAAPPADVSLTDDAELASDAALPADARAADAAITADARVHDAALAADAATIDDALAPDGARPHDAAHPDDASPVDGAPADADAAPRADAAPPGDLRFVGGDAAGRWCGAIELAGAAVVRPDTTLTICAGSVVTVTDPNARLDVAGALRVEGAADAPVRIEAPGGWAGLRVNGTLDATHLLVRDALTCVQGLDDGVVRLTDTRLEDCGRGFELANGAEMLRVDVLRGASVIVRDGVLHMTDSTIDLQHPRRSPDCTLFNGGGAVLDHVRFTGCHCPLHVNRAPAGLSVTASVFDDAAYAMMLADVEATITGSYLTGSAADVLDIGRGIDADLAGNYYGGAAPDVQTQDAAQFVGTDDWLPERPLDVGPRR